MALGNHGQGIYVTAGSNTIGGTATGAGNLISGNSFVGVWLASGNDNLVQGNFIGTDASGTQKLGNGYGVEIAGGASGNTIGGTVFGAANVIAANSGEGIYLTDAGTSNNLIEGNFIGTNASGATGLGNGEDGVDIVDSASGNTIGGVAGVTGNVIADNGGPGVVITDAGTSNNLVLGNVIHGNAVTGVSILFRHGEHDRRHGLRRSQRHHLQQRRGHLHLRLGDIGQPGPGQFHRDRRLWLLRPGQPGRWDRHCGRRRGNTIGGASSGTADVITANSGEGIFISGSGTSGNLVQGNFIGTDAYGYYGPGNLGDGVEIVDGASGNTIGGASTGPPTSSPPTAARASSSPARGRPGTWSRAISSGPTPMATTARATWATAWRSLMAPAGTRLAGPPPAPPTSSPATAAPGSTSPTRERRTTWSRAISSARMPTVLTTWATAEMAWTSLAAPAATPSEALPPAPPTSSPATAAGIDITGPGTSNNLVQGNFIGAIAYNYYSQGNLGDGIGIVAGASGNTIGGASPGAANVIAGNGGVGINISDPGTSNNVVEGNDIGTNAYGFGGPSNLGGGVDIVAGAVGNTIGGTAPGAGNSITASGGSEIVISDAGTSNNLVEGNLILGNPYDYAGPENQSDGIFIANSAPGNTIGGTAAGAANVIGDNSNGPQDDGIEIYGTGTTRNVVQGNFIGIDPNPIDFPFSGNVNGVEISGGARATRSAARPPAPATRLRRTASA